MPTHYSLWSFAPPAGGDRTAQIIKLDEDTHKAALLARAKDHLEARYGWCDELRADGPWLSHPRSPRVRCRQADLVLVTIRDQEQASAAPSLVQACETAADTGQALGDAAKAAADATSDLADVCRQPQSSPSVALYAPHLTRAEVLYRATASPWFARALLVLLLAALIIKAANAP